MAIGIVVAMLATNATNAQMPESVMRSRSVTPQDLSDRFRQKLNVRDFGAIEDYVFNGDGAMTAGSNRLTSATAQFFATDIGKHIAISGAGKLGVALSATISAVDDSHTALLSIAASVTVVSAQYGYGTDDSAAWTAAIQRAISLGKSGTAACVYQPAGISLVSVPMPIFYLVPGCLLGDGENNSIIAVDPQLSGDLFSWSEDWLGSSFMGTNSPLSTKGPAIQGIGVMGFRDAPQNQNAFVFYDRNDQLYINNIGVTSIRGRALYFGAIRNTTGAYLRESHLSNMHFYYDGDSGAAVAEFNSFGNGDQTNEVDIDNLDIYAPFGTGLKVAGSCPATRNLKFNNLRIEGQENGTQAADLLVVADFTADIWFHTLELTDPYRGYVAMRLTAGSASSQPYSIYADGLIGGGLAHGGGLEIDRGRDNQFNFQQIHVDGTGVLLAPTADTGNYINAWGAEKSLKYGVFTAPNGLLTPVLRLGNPAGTGPGSGTTAITGTVIGDALVSNGTVSAASYTYTSLPPAGTAGRMAFCSDCLKPGERNGDGTGMLVLDDGHSRWITSAGTAVAH